jgi:hypothetical protein
VAVITKNFLEQEKNNREQTTEHLSNQAGKIGGCERHE